MAVFSLGQLADCAPVTGDVGELLCSAPTLQFALHHRGFIACSELLDVEKLQWMPLCGVSVSFSRVVLPHPLVRIIRVPDVQSFIGALNDVEAERHDSVPFDSSLRPRSGRTGRRASGVHNTPRFIWSLSIDSKSAWKLPSPKPSLPLRWMISKKIGPMQFWVKICSSSFRFVSMSASIRILFFASRGTSSPWLGTRTSITSKEVSGVSRN